MSPKQPREATNLFAAAGMEQDAPHPLPDRLRPRTLSDVVGQDHILGPDGALTRIVDTRKTTPGMRFLERYSVRTGGGHNHRMGLYDAILIKENHIALAGSLAKAVYGARSKHPELAVEVECRNLDEVAYALGTGADILLLDNMDLETLRGAVRLRDENATAGKGPSLEASGGVDLETVRGIAETGVDLISVGALTHSAPTLDFSMLIEPA